MLRRLTTFVVALLAPCALSLAQSHSLGLQQLWSTGSGLPQNSVHALARTPDGLLWIGTESGLARFDGYSFHIFTASPASLPGNGITALQPDPHDQLWVGTDGGLARLSPLGRTATTLTSSPVRALALTPTALYVLTSSGLSAIPSGQLTDEHPVLQPIPTPSSIIALAVTPSGGLLAATVEPSLYQLTGATLRLYTRLPAPGPVVSVAALPTGLAILQQSTLTLFVPDRSPRILTAGRELPGARLQALLALPGAAPGEAELWVGTDAGLAHIVHGQTQPVPPLGELTRASILSLAPAPGGALLAGTETLGLALLHAPLFTTLGRPEGLLPDPAATDAVTSLAQSPSGLLALGTDTAGLLTFVPPFTPPLHPLLHAAPDSTPTLATATVLSTAVQAGGTLWAGTPDGLFRIRGSRVLRLTSADGLPDETVRSLLAAPDGSLWAGTRHGLAHILPAATPDAAPIIQPVATGTLPGSDLIGAIAQLPGAPGEHSDLWVATLAGLARIAPTGALTTYTGSNGLPGGAVSALAASCLADHSVLWVGLFHHGLVLWDGARFASFATLPSLPQDISALLDDCRGHLWVASERGLLRVAIAGLLRYAATHDPAAVDPVSYTTADGLRSPDVTSTGHPSAMRLDDGRLAFATTRGLLLVDPLALPSTATPPALVESVTLSDTPQPLPPAGQPLVLPPGRVRLTLAFAAVSLYAPQRLLYRYRLLGFDRDWVEAGAGESSSDAASRRRATYTNLPPGDYRFVVQARQPGEPWPATDSAASTVALALQPRLIQTLWFRTLLVLVAALLLWLATRAVLHLRLRAAQQRFAAVSAERNRLAREIHDTLAQGFVAVSVQLEILSQLLTRAEPAVLREQLDATRTMVRHGLEEARASIWSLRSTDENAPAPHRSPSHRDQPENPAVRPPELLPARLARLAAATPGAPAHVQATGPQRPLSPAIESELTRIAGEAIANARRHAHATRITVTLAYTAEDLTLTVADDGRGFDPSTAVSTRQGHFGITGMAERAREIDATLTLISAPGQGATLTVTVPLPATDHVRIV